MNDNANNTDNLPVPPTHLEIDTAAEELQVGKRPVQEGTVNIRKVVRTEQEEVPVELRHENVEVERVDLRDADVPANAFQEQEIDVPVMREEPVMAREAHVTGAVRVNKDVRSEQRTVGGDVRREDVEIDQSGVDEYVITPDERSS